MDIFKTIALTIHIASGTTALITGLIAILAKKGQKTHKLAGKIFFISMLTVAGSAIIISIVIKNYFLLMIGIFALLMDYFGFRAIKNKSLKPNLLDWAVLIMGFVNSFFMIYSMNTILLVFGTINSFLVLRVLRINILLMKNKPLQKLEWLIRHIGMMLGTYIATTTAFVVVNVKNVTPDWLPWLLPTFIGVPIIFFWIRKYSAKKAVAPGIQN
jgi:hypothetical protein